MLMNCVHTVMEHFLKRAAEAHGDKYDYSLVEYIDSRTYVQIICPIHGIFSQLPLNHYRYGCNKCSYVLRSKNQMKNTDSFINESMVKHPNKYTYDKCNYTGAHQKVTISCPAHGDFCQSPRSHLNGRGCPMCKQGELHPRYGKPSPATGYYGIYHSNTFRSLAELFWMIGAEQFSKPFVALDQMPTRAQWQVAIEHEGKKTTYCPDFYLPNENKVIDIKPLWRVKREAWKLEPAQKEYGNRGVQFEIIDCNTIATDIKIVIRMHKAGEIFLYPASIEKLKRRTAK